jgi:hypothetical protein
MKYNGLHERIDGQTRKQGGKRTMVVGAYYCLTGTGPQLMRSQG